MSKPLLAEDVRIGATAAGSGYDILRVTTDPRLAPGLAADPGTMVQYVTAQSSIFLVKYTTWDRGWRVPGSGPVYPNSADLFLGATKLTPGALYLNDQMTGNLFDASGNGNTLTVNNTPTFQQSIDGKVGVWYDTNADAHLANVNDPAASSFVWGGVQTFISPVGIGFNGFVGRFVGGSNKGYAMWTTGAGALTYSIIDAAGNTVTGVFPTVDFSLNPKVSYLVSGQIDKATNRFRGRVSRGGAVVATVDVSAAALGTLSFGGQNFFQGSPGGALGAGVWNGYTYYAAGVQAEGANVLRDLAVGLGWET